MKILPSLLLIFCISGSNALAAKLKLENTGGEDIVIRYLPVSQRGNTMHAVVIKSQSSESLNLTAKDPYDVSVELKGYSDQTAIHAKASREIPLLGLAKALQGQGVDVSAIPAAMDLGNGKTTYQVTLASLDYRLNGQNQSISLIKPAQESSNFIKGVIKGRWKSVYVAVNGRRVEATIDFTGMTFQTNQFTGRFTDLTITENNRICHIYGRWYASGSRGNVYFKIDKQQPNSFVGHSTLDGRKGRLGWNGNR